MKKITLIWNLIFAVLIVSCNATKSTSVKETTKVNHTKLANSLLWKITGNGLEKPSYLFGTIHLTCNYQLSDKIKNALNKTEQLTLELDIDMNDPAVQMSLMKLMLMKDGKTIKGLLTESEYAKLDTFFKENVGMSLSLFNTMKPFVITSLLTSKLVDCDNAKSYEEGLTKLMKAQNKPLLGLETIAYQLSVFDSIPYKEQLQEILKMVDEDISESKTTFKKMDALYQKENIEGLYNLMTETEGMELKHKDQLLDIRNQNWIPLIKKMAADKPTFFGVGALHLAGENGVIKLLQKQGFNVTAVF